MKSIVDKVSKFSPLLLGVPASVNILHDANDPTKLFLNALTLVVSVLLTRWAQKMSTAKEKTEKEQEALNKRVNNVANNEASARENIGNQVSVLGSKVEMLTKEVQTISGERDKFRDSWGKELVAHSETKVKLNEQIDQLVKINTEQHDSYEELKGRFDKLERKVETHQSVESLAQTILNGMGQVVGQAVGQAVSQALAAYTIAPKLPTVDTPAAAIPSVTETAATPAT